MFDFKKDIDKFMKPFKGLTPEEIDNELKKLTPRMKLKDYNRLPHKDDKGFEPASGDLARTEDIIKKQEDMAILFKYHVGANNVKTVDLELVILEK